MVRVYAVFDGINGAGKSTYRRTFEDTQRDNIGRLLSQGESALFLDECVASPERRREWYATLGGKNPTGIDYERLHRNLRLTRHRELIVPHQGFVSEERNPLAWWYYCRALKEFGKLSPREFHRFESETLSLMEQIAFPDIWVFIEAYPDIARQRIVADSERSSAEQEHNSEEYLKLLAKHMGIFSREGVYEWAERLERPRPHVITANATISLDDIPMQAQHKAEEIFRAVEHYFREKRISDRKDGGGEE